MRTSMVVVLILFLTMQCKIGDWQGNATDNPVVSTLFNNRMLLLVKATYATDNPLAMTDYDNGSGQFYVDSTGTGGDPAHNFSGLPAAKDLPIYIDIGEIRLSSKYQKGLGDLSQIRDAKGSQSFWDNIAPNREVYCNVPYTLNSNTCREQNGEFKFIQLFNGEGAAYPSNDPTSGSGFLDLPTQYYYTGIFIRSLITGWGILPGIDLTKVTFFDNYPVYGFNIVPRMAYAPRTSSSDKNLYPPLVFPLLYQVQIGEDDMGFKPGFDPYIFEVRMNLKENLMVHSFSLNNGTNATLISVSDWKVDHQGETDIGGDILSRARVIYPDKASKLAITGGTGSKLHYYAIFRPLEQNILQKLPLIASPALSGTTPIKYIMPGTYRLICLSDTARRDGFPDTIVNETTFSVPENPGSTVSVSLSCP
ncbi:hypothetical protein CH373_04525 [Leptospira perolatii]|uniref:Uncharacterized protein n=1 Tax=Leptospira perolatii TaxID=2023191 RepID=A0A2M9ZR61_9LEPT|nr:hypothetical protein [Leptospira perolatii]PJZ68264.1 hypothetical protein CH360_17250 [Leptospira perolatii]PJZ74461.1 hypothetical protein CH373_04525 [Leptospira perolatii]